MDLVNMVISQNRTELRKPEPKKPEPKKEKHEIEGLSGRLSFYHFGQFWRSDSVFGRQCSALNQLKQHFYKRKS